MIASASLVMRQKGDPDAGSLPWENSVCSYSRGICKNNLQAAGGCRLEELCMQ